MFRFITNITKYSLAIALLGFSAYSLSEAYKKHQNPCLLPVTYKINDFDTRFGISQESYLEAIKASELAWEKAAGKDLFTYDQANGRVAMNLIYDERQLATDKLDTLDDKIDNNKESYESIKSRYDTLVVEYERSLAAYEQSRTTYETELKSYEANVRYWNDRGGAPDDEYKKLQDQKKALASMQNSLETERKDLNETADNINSLATRLNTLATNLNGTIKQYNAIGKTVSAEFDQGLYERDEAGERISIFQFENMPALIHVLTHELGHALLLEHSENAASVMYYLHQDEPQQVTSQDVEALKTVCKI